MLNEFLTSDLLQMTASFIAVILAALAVMQPRLSSMILEEQEEDQLVSVRELKPRS